MDDSWDDQYAYDEQIALQAPNLFSPEGKNVLEVRQMSRSRALKIHRELFEQLHEYYTVFIGFWDFVFAFGFKDNQQPNPFAFHLILITSALFNWQWYIESLEKCMTDQTDRVVLTNVQPGKLSPVQDFQIFKPSSTRHRIENKFGERIREVQLYKKKTEVLHSKAHGVAQLLFDLLDYENAQIAQQNGEALKDIAEDSRNENQAMRLLTEKSTRDNRAVKVLTFITLIYPPTTVVASFFSSQFVQFDSGGPSPKLKMAANTWLFAATPGPLTILTFLVWYAWISWRKVSNYVIDHFGFSRPANHRDLEKNSKSSKALLVRNID
ncbi:MAG: hypothetical protein M1827_005800 [Pycnora praestabilis]|nr:MAG: hypothetical protein M1827_005800 [Pycnora praestabilis]